MTRLDALSPEQVLQGAPSRASGRFDADSDKTRHHRESGFRAIKRRSVERKRFQKMARDMSNRYISVMPVFDQSAESTDLASILGSDLTEACSSRANGGRYGIEFNGIVNDLGIGEHRHAVKLRN